MNKWISIEDSLPKVNERVIGYDEFYERVGEAYLPKFAPDRLIFIDSDDCYITHWQPMPECLKKEENESL